MGWFGSRERTTLELLAERQRRTEEEVLLLGRTVGEIHASLVVRDPGNRLSAEAYDGLRKTVIAGATQRRAHLVQLVEFATALERGADTQQLRSLVEEWLIQADVAQFTDPSRPECFEILGGSGEGLAVLAPAWIDSQTGALIKRGTAERIALPPRHGPSPAGAAHRTTDAGEAKPMPLPERPGDAEETDVTDSGRQVSGAPGGTPSNEGTATDPQDTQNAPHAEQSGVLANSTDGAATDDSVAEGDQELVKRDQDLEREQS